MANIKPLSPNEVVFKRKFPDGVIAVWNSLLKGNVSGEDKSIVLHQTKVLGALKEAYPHMEHDQFLKEGWLDIEDLYRRAGWIVTYEKSAYNEPFYDPYFTFTKPKPPTYIESL